MVKRISLLLAMLMVVSLFAACGGTPSTPAASGGDASAPASSSTESASSGDDSQAGEPAAVEQVTIRFMTWEGETMNNAMVATMDAFMVANPHIKVELEPSPLTDYGIKLQEMLAAEIAPDIFMVGNDMALNYQVENLVVDVKPYLDADPEFRDGFYPGVFATFTRDGKMAGLPGLINLYGIFYNKKYFDDAGLDYPTKDWTYDDMFAAAEALMDPASSRYGLYINGTDAFHTSIYAASKDNTPFCDEIFPVGKVTASDSFKEAITRYANAIKMGALTSPTYDNTNLTGNFMQGAVPMMRYGQWAADELIRNAPEDLDWGYVPNPKVNTNAQIIDCVGWSINAQTADADAAFAVLKYLESETYKEVLGQTPVANPAFQAAAENYYGVLVENGHEDMAEALDYMMNAEQKLPVRFLDSWSALAYRFLDADWNAFITGERDVNEIDAALIDNINSVIE